MRRLLPVGLAALVAGGLSARTAQNPPASNTARTVWDGVYTDAQAARGEARYRMTCGGCHDEGPRKGEAFLRDWSGIDLGGLFTRMKTSMPPGKAGSLPDADYIDIAAYMLRVNDFPAGRDELTAASAATIRVEGRGGADVVPNFALVRVVGCLSAGPGSDWTVANASAPVRTRNPAASTGDELKDAQSAATAGQTFRVQNVYPRPEAYVGHRVEAKGFLIRDPAGDRINATSLESLAAGCDKPAP